MGRRNALDLTPREAELHAHLLSAASMKQIAHQMGITIGSSKVIARRLYGKLGLGDRFEVMAADKTIGRWR